MFANKRSGCYRSGIKRIRRQLDLRKNRICTSDLGYKSIQKKSIHFTNSRFRDKLMEIAMLCRETSVSNFVENLDDI